VNTFSAWSNGPRSPLGVQCPLTEHHFLRATNRCSSSCHDITKFQSSRLGHRDQRWTVRLYPIHLSSGDFGCLRRHSVGPGTRIAFLFSSITPATIRRWSISSDSASAFKIYEACRTLAPLPVLRTNCFREIGIFFLPACCASAQFRFHRVLLQVHGELSRWSCNLSRYFSSAARRCSTLLLLQT